MPPTFNYSESASAFPPEKYAENGFAVERKIIPREILIDIEKSIAAVVQNHIKRHAPEISYEISQMSANEVTQKGVIMLREIDNDLVRGVADTLLTNPVLNAFLYSDLVRYIALKYTGAPDEKFLSFINPYIRLDLPNSYNEQDKKLSLPWHQESSYYEVKAACENAIVISTNPFGCSRDEGCVVMAPGSHKKGKLEHKRYYKDPKNKRNYRVEINPDEHDCKEFVPAESTQGDVAVFNFNTFHRSGQNQSDKVRYTLLVRASNIADDDYVV
jgi:ectoine hydroxylase-related dioxygenase (phytanoyl-CoA dioxygenase family)